MSPAQTAIKKQAEADLNSFARLVGINRVYGTIHTDVFRWLSNETTLDQLLLLPRGHLKSHCVAVWCAWHITRHPDTTILYVSATEDLAIQQLSAIKGILESDVYRRYWPDMIKPEEAKRAEWNVRNIKVDHPLREKLGIRDRTVAARSIDSNTTGLHCDVLIFDDIVAPDNAYTNDGRQRVKAGYSQFASIANPGAIQKVVGTRYHGQDVYGMMMEMEQEIFNEAGEITGSLKVYEVFSRVVEEEGIFLWPREQHPKTQKWYGYDHTVLAVIRAKYFGAGERLQYYAQYYNNPNEVGEGGPLSDKFQYYDRKYLTERDGDWYFRDKLLNVFCAVDLAYTVTSTADFTALAVIGLDSDGFIYILELDQFRTNKYDRTYKAISRLQSKWKFRKMRMETNAGANLVAEYVKDEVRKDGIALQVEGKAARGDKSERCNAILIPRYENQTVLHYTGGLITTYEEQVILPRPSHDDLRDAVAAAVEISKPAPKRQRDQVSNVIQFNPRFGGRVR